jgi:hypothetical protein
VWGHKWFIFWVPLQNRLVNFLSLGFITWTMKTLSLFVGAELDPRGHGLSHLKPGVDTGELIGVSGGVLL